jgi:hypothetical protein
MMRGIGHQVMFLVIDQSEVQQLMYFKIVKSVDWQKISAELVACIL